MQSSSSKIPWSVSKCAKSWSIYLLRITSPQIPLLALLISSFALLALLFLNAAIKQREEFFAHYPDEVYEGASQDHPDLIAYIRQLHIHAPIQGDYNLKNPEIQDPSQNQQAKVVADIFKNKTKGTFFEAGAYDGEELSNTLYLERNFNWRGLLVEPDPWNYWSLRKKIRKSSALQGCISPTIYSKEVSFKQSDTMGRVIDSTETKEKGIFTRVKCFPLFSLLLAQNLTKLDFLSLDVEGNELDILKTLPWDKVDISVICVEHKHIPEGGLLLKQYLEERNYRLQVAVGDDYIFVKNSFDNKKLKITSLSPLSS